MSELQLPVIDLNRLGATGRERDAFLGELRESAHRFGFLYVTGHGIAHTQVQYLFHLARRFFDLSEEEKLLIDQLNSPHFRGYTLFPGGCASSRDARRKRQAVRRLLLRREPGCDGTAAQAGTRICRQGARAHARPAQSAVPPCRAELPEKPATLASGRGPRSLCRPFDAGRAGGGTRGYVRVLNGNWNHRSVVPA